MQFFAIKDIGQINFNTLISQLPGRNAWNPFSTQGQYITAILQSYDTLQRYGITNALRLAHFLGQGIVETGFLRYKAENLNYSKDGLLKVFGRYFTESEAARYARKPEMIANRVYANRMGNGDEASGDGWRYRGRGFFQLTGKNNYEYYGELAGIDLVNNPEVLEKDLRTSVQVAAAFFGKTGLGEYADRNDIAGVSRGVNRGNPTSRLPAHGEDERIIWTTKALSLVRNPESIVINSEHVEEVGPASLTVGDEGEEVAELQRNLNALGYPVGTVDGIFGRNTRRAILAFQDEHGLTATAVADDDTRQMIEEALADPRGGTGPVDRSTATASDARRAGATEIAKADQVSTAGVATGVAGAAAAANEAGLVEPVVDAVREQFDSSDDAVDDTVEDAAVDTGTDTAPTVDVEEEMVDTQPTDEDVVEDVVEDTAPEEETTETTETVEQPDRTDVDTAAMDEGTDWTLVIILVIVALIGLYTFFRSRSIVEDRVEDYRSGKVL